MKKRKLGITTMDVLAIVFLIIGSLFTLLGFLLFIDIDTLTYHGTGDARIVPMVFLGVGLPFLAGGLYALWFTLHRRAMIQLALKEGYYVLADVDEIVYNTHLEVNGQHPFYAVCLYQDPNTNTTMEFRSKNLYYEPKELLHQKIRVYCLKDAMKYYYVDIDDAFHEDLK